MSKSALFLLILVSLFSTYSNANECGKTLSNLTSPVCTDAKYIFWTGAAITLGMRLLKDTFVDDLQRRAVKKNHLKNFADFGDEIGYGYLNGLYILGTSLLGGQKGEQRAQHMLEASFYSFSVTYALKKSIHETRPGFPEDKDSFPSGHSSFAFAFASVVTAQHGWAWGGVAHTAATFIAFSRMNDDWHYIHDIVAGMTIGMSYGWGIYWNHEDHNKPYWVSILPTPKMDGLFTSIKYSY